ncbi:MAG: T9SS type A sorting domain-containing protein [Candidatus Kapabacteria bacterium]|nr:T9SS type A sorting domain-containing protein [Candidatus Kapabacteria bacterium]
MKTLIILLFVVFSYSLCFTKPQFKKIDNLDFILYNDIINFQNKYIMTAGNESERYILICDSTFLLIDSISHTQLLDIVKDDLNLTEWDNLGPFKFAVDSNGILWIVTHKAVFNYDFKSEKIIKVYHHKNSVLPEKNILNIFIEKDTIVIYPNANEIYYFSDNIFTKVKFPIDTTMGEWTKFPYSYNAVLHRGKFYYLTGFSKNLIVFDGINFTLYDSGDYIVDKYQQHGHLLKSYNGSVYFFEIKNRLNLIKFTDGKFSVTDFNKSDIFKIPNNCVLYYYDFEFDKIGNLWLSFQTNDTVTSKIEQYLLRYNSVTDFDIYKIDDLISGFNDGAFEISIITETNEIFLSTNYSIYKTDLNTGVKETADNLPNLFILNVFPNPASDFIDIQTSEVLETSEVSKVQIFDMLGIEMFSVVMELDLSTQRIDISHLPTGVYYIRIGHKVEKFLKM